MCHKTCSCGIPAGGVSEKQEGAAAARVTLTHTLIDGGQTGAGGRVGEADQ